VLIGRLGLDKRLARCAGTSRIGFVHEFGPLSSGEVRQLLVLGWNIPGDLDARCRSGGSDNWGDGGKHLIAGVGYRLRISIYGNI
jgi:hypothetical protein